MLKNEGVGQSKKKVLPLDTGKRTLLVGPMIGSNALDGGYEYVDGVSSLGSGLAKVANWTNLTTATGCQVTCPSHGKGNCSDTTALDAAVAAANDTDKSAGHLHAATARFDGLAAALEADLLAHARASPTRVLPLPTRLLTELAEREDTASTSSTQ